MMILQKTSKIAFLIVFASGLLLPIPFQAGSATISPRLEAVLDQPQAAENLSIIMTLSSGEEIRAVTRNSGKKRRNSLVRNLKELAHQTQAPVKERLRNLGISQMTELWLVNGLAFEAPAHTVEDMRHWPEVTSLEANETVNLAPSPLQSYPIPGWNIQRVRAPDLWDLGITGEGVVVAILDSGVDLHHPDLQANWRGTVDDPISGWFDPYEISPLPTDPIPIGTSEGLGHGTAVTGLVIAGDGLGHPLGVAPGAQWIAARIFDEEGTATRSVIIQSLQWTMDPDGDGNTDDAADIVNNSWGVNLTDDCYTSYQTAIRALKDAGIAVVAAAGNSGPELATSESPANYPEVIGVGATQLNNTIADFSARGPSACDGSLYPDMVAPGVTITTTDTGGNYVTVSGTSFSTPHVAGGMALLMSAFPGATLENIEDALRIGATDLGPSGPENTYGYGLLNVLSAYNVLAETNADIDNVPPPPPELLNPADGAMVEGPDVAFSWRQAPDADGDEIVHTLVISQRADFSDAIALPVEEGFLLSAAAGLSIFLMALRIGRRSGRWLVLCLTVGSIAVLLSCGGGGGDGDDGDDPVVIEEPVPEPAPVPDAITFEATGFVSGEAYYWKVVAEDAQGGISESSVRSFTVE